MEMEFKNHDRLLFSLFTCKKVVSDFHARKERNRRRRKTQGQGFTREGGGESGGKGQFSRSLKSKKKESHQRDSSREEPEELAIVTNKKKKKKKEKEEEGFWAFSLSVLCKETPRVSGNGRSRAFWDFRFSPAFLFLLYFSCRREQYLPKAAWRPALAARDLGLWEFYVWVIISKIRGPLANFICKKST